MQSGGINSSQQYQQQLEVSTAVSSEDITDSSQRQEM